MKTIHVVAAIIYHNGKFFATQRGYGEFAGMWEFPGGKIEPGESSAEALKREIREELGVEICVGEHICTTEYDYPSFHLSMQCFLCTFPNEEEASKVELREHLSAQWLDINMLNSIEWLPADQEIITLLKKVHS